MSIDHDTLKQLARLKFAMRKAKIGTLDLERYSTDDAYARSMLDQAEEADDEEIVMLAVEIRHKRGLLETGAGQAKSHVNADGSPTRHIDKSKTSTKPGAGSDSKAGIMSRMFGRSKPESSADASTTAKSEEADQKYMFGPRG